MRRPPDLAASEGVAPVSPSAGGRARVAAHLLPVRRFDQACDLVVDYLTSIAPMGVWAVTRVHQEEQVLLATQGDAYPVEEGVVLPYRASFCRSVVAGVAPASLPTSRWCRSTPRRPRRPRSRCVP